AGCDHELVVDRSAGQELGDQLMNVGQDLDRADIESRVFEKLPDGRAALVRRLARRSTITDGQYDGPHFRCRPGATHLTCRRSWRAAEPIPGSRPSRRP